MPKTVPSGNDAGKAHDYRITESAVDGYTTTYAQANGKAIITNTLNVLSIRGEKTWTDESDKYSLRPSSISLTVKAGTPAADIAVQPKAEDITWTKKGDLWSYTIANLPLLYNGAPAVYTVKEEAVEGYTPFSDTASGTAGAGGSIIKADFENVLDTGARTVEKSRIGGKDDDFSFTVDLTGKESQHYLYTGEYKIYDASAIGVSAKPIATRKTSSDGVMTIKGGQKLYIEGLPDGWYYSVTEQKTDDYNVTGTMNVQGTIVKGAVIEAVYTNSMINELAIDNITKNPAAEYAGGTPPTNVGGTVAVEAAPFDGDYDTYKEETTTVVWKPNDGWNHANSFSVTYWAIGETASRTIEINGFLNADGTVKPSNDSVYDALRAQYPDFTIAMSADRTITLVLAKDALGMTRRQRVDVSFTPTLAVENTTSDDKGGKVEVQGGVFSGVSDGRPDKDGSGRYEQTVVIGEASDGFMVDMNNITIGSPNTSGGDVKHNGDAVTIKPDANGRFSVQITTTLGGKTEKVNVTGIVVVIAKDIYGNPTQIKVALDSLPINLDIGVPFTTANIPAATIAQTGDSTNLTLLYILLIVSGAAIICIAIYIKKRKHTNTK
ncbi:MAG: Cna B-type domain-containing protein [Clostridia bacterium]|nr:Cna B-type domain-containing protein [Clostridia bacterium]